MDCIVVEAQIGEDLYAGIDMHRKQWCITVPNEDDRRLFSNRRGRRSNTKDVRRERLTCLARFLLVPEAMRDTISGKDFFYRLAFPVLPPLTGLTRRHEDTKDAKEKPGKSDKAGDRPVAPTISLTARECHLSKFSTLLHFSFFLLHFSF